MKDQRTEEQVAYIDDDIADLGRQVAAGDIDEATASDLLIRYEAERKRLTDESLRTQEPEESVGEKTPADTRRMNGRAIAGVSIVSVALVVIAALAVNSLTGPSMSGVQGLTSDVVAGTNTVALSDVSNEEMEAVVAENPDVVGMRLALARRYFEAGDFENALRHYFVILDKEKHPEALANVGWMTYISGRPDVALGYIEASLERQPGSVTTIWFLGNIQYALGNYAEASVALVVVVGTDEIPDDVRIRAESLLREMGNA